MDNGHFEVGRFQCFAVRDGEFAYDHPSGILFPDAPREQLTEALADWDIEQSNWQSWNSPYSCLLVDTGVQKIENKMTKNATIMPVDADATHSLCALDQRKPEA